MKDALNKKLSDACSRHGVLGVNRSPGNAPLDQKKLLKDIRKKIRTTGKLFTLGLEEME